MSDGAEPPGVEPGERDPSRRAIGLFALSAAGVTVIALIAAAAGDGPYLAADHVNGWIVVFAAGLFALLIAFPFAIAERLSDRIADRDRRWEVALATWAGFSLVVLGAAIVVAASAGFDLATLAGAAGVIAALEAALVFAVVVVWILSD